MEYKKFEDYLFYEDGSVFSLLTGKHITKRVSPTGYYHINLCIKGKCKTFQFHRLIARLFIPNPDNKPQINHKDGNKLNNSLENLEWVTQSENVLHALRTGLKHPARGKATKFGRFSEEDIREMRALKQEGKSQSQIAAIYKTTKGTIQHILRGKTYKWVV